MTTTDVLVIGAGMVGTMTALRLAEAGAGVTLIDGEFPGSGSTGAAMGHLVVMDDSPAQLELCAHSLRRWTDLLADLGPRAESSDTGTLWLADSSDELAAAEAKVATYHQAGLQAEVLDAAALAEAEPELRPGLSGGLRVAGDKVCYPPWIARELAARAERAGAILRQGCKVTEVGAGLTLCADGSTISSGAVVIAAGAHSAELVPGLPLMPRRGHLVITERTPLRVHHQLVELGYLHSAHSMGGASVAFNVQPRSTGQLLVGSSRELVGFDSGINRELVGRMVERAIEFVPGLATASASRTWIGFRPATPDSLPLIGAWPAIDGCWIATGHEGLGITMAPGTADIITTGILGEATPVGAEAFLPTRPMAAVTH